MTFMAVGNAYDFHAGWGRTCDMIFMVADNPYDLIFMPPPLMNPGATTRRTKCPHKGVLRQKNDTSAAVDFTMVGNKQDFMAVVNAYDFHGGVMAVGNAPDVRFTPSAAAASMTHMSFCMVFGNASDFHGSG